MLSFPVAQILVPIDFSDLSMTALDSAKTMVKSPSGLHVVSILAPIMPPSPGIVWGTIDDRERIESVRNELKSLLQQRGLGEAQMHVRVGTPASEVAKLVDDLPIDLVVLTSHGRTGLARFAMGSVAELIVRHAKSPVLVLK